MTDPWNGLRIRTGHREKLLQLARRARAARHRELPARGPGRSPRRDPARAARRRGPPTRRARPRRPDLDDRPRAALAAHGGQGLLLDAAAPLGPVHRGAAPDDARGHRRRRRPAHPAHHRPPRRLAHRRGRLRIHEVPLSVREILSAPRRRGPSPSERDEQRLHHRRRATAPRRSTRTPTASTRCSPTSSRTPCGTAAAGWPRPATPRAVSGRPDAGAASACSDDGAGIPAEQRRAVFSRFWHGPSGSGTGLGLYIVKGIVEAHGGWAEIDDAPGGGAVVRVFFPGEPI